jgi:hypothetical protein
VIAEVFHPAAQPVPLASSDLHAARRPLARRMPAWPVPADVASGRIAEALADPAWTAEMWPSGEPAWLHLGPGIAEVLSPVDGDGTRLGAGRRLASKAASAGAFASLGSALLAVVIVGHGDVRLDPVDLVMLDSSDLARLPYAIRALALADALERLREANPAGIAPCVRPSRTPATGAAKRALVGRADPLRLVLRDLRAPFGLPGSLIRVPSAGAGFFDDPWL